jgi:hypothetical protein
MGLGHRAEETAFAALPRAFDRGEAREERRETIGAFVGRGRGHRESLSFGPAKLAAADS